MLITEGLLVLRTYESGKRKSGFSISLPFLEAEGFLSWKMNALTKELASNHHDQASHEIPGQHAFPPGFMPTEDTGQRERKRPPY